MTGARREASLALDTSEKKRAWLRTRMDAALAEVRAARSELHHGNLSRVDDRLCALEHILAADDVAPARSCPTCGGPVEWVLKSKNSPLRVVCPRCNA